MQTWYNIIFFVYVKKKSEQWAPKKVSTCQHEIVNF